MTNPTSRQSIDFDCPIGQSKARLLLAFVDGRKPAKPRDVIASIGSGTLTCPVIARGDAAELLIFLDEAVRQRKTLDVRAGLVKLAAGGTIEITLQTPP